MGTILLFVLSPPRLTPADEAASWVHLARFVGAISVAVLLVVIHRGRWSLRRLQWTTIAIVLAALASFFVYRVLVGFWTCNQYDGRGPIVIGSKLLPEAERHYEQSGISACGMIQDAAGDTSSIWAYSELFARHLFMAGAFLITVSLFLISAILAVELLRALTDPKTTHSRRTG